MKVLLCLHHYLNPNQGAPGATLALGRALEEAGCEVEYFGFDHAFPKTKDGRISNPIRFPWKLASYLSHYADRFDVIDVSTGDNWVWATRGRPGAKKRHALITRSHGLEHTVDTNVRQDAKSGVGRLGWKYPFYHGGYRLWEVAKSLQLADMVFMLNQHERHYAVQQFAVNQKRIRLVESGIPTHFLGLPINDMEQSSPAKISIAQVGSYIARKGIMYACKALNSLLARHPQVTMTFLGTGCPEAQVHGDFNPTVRGRVGVVPRFVRKELPHLLEGNQIFLFPSLSEGFSTALPEAMSCGLAPVATAIPGNIEIVENEKNALLIPPRDSDAIEQALERLISSPMLLHQLRQEAYATAQHYGWARIASDTLALYEEALQTRPL